MSDDHLFPDPPTISEELMQQCRSSGDYRPVMFEWYKYVGMVANFFSSVQQRSPAIRSLPIKHYGILIGLLNRCSRLMLSNVAISHEGSFGETTAIIDRCIFESCIKIEWLCSRGDDHSFNSYVADGLKTEVEFKSVIKSKIAARNQVILKIEESMLESIERAIVSSGMSEDEIKASKKLPNLRAMTQQLQSDDLAYVVGQRIGSHHVHGTWLSLRNDYLVELEDGSLCPRDQDVETHVYQYIYIPVMVLSAIDALIDFLVNDDQYVSAFHDALEWIRNEIHKLNMEFSAGNFDRV